MNPRSAAVALYVRVSTDKQTTANQLAGLRRLAEARGLRVAAVYEEVESGAKRRPVLEQLRSDARGAEWGTVLVWALDRLGRGGALEALTLLGDLDRERVAVVSLQESWLDTSADNPMRDVLIAFTATIARMERSRLIERTRAGLDRARREGKRLGRPPSSPILMGAALDRVRRGISIRQAARLSGVTPTSLRRAVAASKVAPGTTKGSPPDPVDPPAPKPSRRARHGRDHGSAT